TETASQAERSTIPRKQTNLFCIPVTDQSATVSLKNYYWILALSYRDMAVGKVARFREQLTTRPGPFLISTLVPMPEVTSGSPILFADLSVSHPLAMKQIVATYESRIIERPLRGDEAFSPLKLKLLSGAYIASDGIALAKAYLPHGNR